MKNTLLIILLTNFLAACGSGGGGSSSPGGPGGEATPTGKGSVTEWQSSLLGQEGHGGDALVCFNIPVDRALYKANVGDSENNGNNCVPPGPCSDSNTSVSPQNPSGGSGVVWRMTDEGRKSILSAKPLEQFLAEKISSKKILVDQLNQISVEEGYRKILSPIIKLPAPFSRLSEIHQKLGWLHEDGISSEYGLMDVNDSGFLNENEIDKTYCKELQAVVRRDNQLWYDADIVRHFDNAGRVLIQLHEEFYAWGKQQDAINQKAVVMPAHETSIKTRRLILKLLEDGIDEKFVNENLKASGFSIMYSDNIFNIPTSVGYFMDTATCQSEQSFLKNFFKNISYGRDFWLDVEMLFSKRYLKSGNSWTTIELRNNFPDVLSNMIALTMAGESSTFASDILKLQALFEQPGSCQGSF